MFVTGVGQKWPNSMKVSCIMMMMMMMMMMMIVIPCTTLQYFITLIYPNTDPYIKEGKMIPLQARCGPEGG